MKKIGYDTMQLDTLQIVEDSRCCLKVNAVITKEGVYPYPDGRAFKSRMELLKATHTARNAKITILDHPDSLVVMSQKQINGIVEKPFFDRDRIRAVLNFDKSTCPPDFLDNVRNGKLKDVSIGFYYQPDLTPGKWNDSPYDYVMRDIVIDHVAAGVLKGRCSYPSCGIGVDTMMRRISFQEDKVVQRGNKWCVIHCHGEEEGDIIKCFDTKGEAEAMHRAIQAHKGDQEPKTEEEHAKAHFHISDEEWEKLSPKEKQDYIDKLPPVGTKRQSLDQGEKPPKDWMDNCKAVVSQNMPSYSDEQVNAVCGNIWYHEPEQQGIGDTAVNMLRELIKKGGIIKKMSEKTPEMEAFIKEYMTQGHTREQAEEHWNSITPPKEDQEPEEETPLQKCVAGQIEKGKTEAEATDWCKAELAGEHQTVDVLIERSKKLIGMREQSVIEQRRSERRHPS